MNRIDALKVVGAVVAMNELPHATVMRSAFPTVDLGTRDDCAQACFAFYGSLDAARMLHEDVVPDWAWTVRKEADGYDANLEPLHGPSIRAAFSIKSAAHAWLLAIVRALIAIEEDK